MKLGMRKYILGMLFGIAGLSGSISALAANTIVVEEAWIREAPPGVHALAGYAKIKNAGGKLIYLEGVSSDSFAMSMLHMSQMDKDNQMTMHHMDKISIPAGQAIQMKPGGMHIMLMRPKMEYKAGDKVAITLEFSSGLKKKLDFSVLRK